MLQIELIIDGAAKEIVKIGLANEENAFTLDSKAASETARSALWLIPSFALGSIPFTAPSQLFDNTHSCNTSDQSRMLLV